MRRWHRPHPVAGFQMSTRVTARSSLVLPLAEFHAAPAKLQECLEASRKGPLRFE